MADEGNGEVKWELNNGVMTVVKETGSVFTKLSFGDCQLHLNGGLPKSLLVRAREEEIVACSFKKDMNYRFWIVTIISLILMARQGVYTTIQPLW